MYCTPYKNLSFTNPLYAVLVKVKYYTTKRGAGRYRVTSDWRGISFSMPYEPALPRGGVRECLGEWVDFAQSLPHSPIDQDTEIDATELLTDDDQQFAMTWNTNAEWYKETS